MKSLLGKRWLWLLLGLILLSAVIWIGGPYLSFADYPPLASALARGVLIALLFAVWGARVLWRGLSASRAASRLAGQMARQEDPAAARASADARQMEQRFEEAVEALRGSRKGRTSLYDLPWYIIIGPPGAGKTTAIVNSGLNFPLAQKFGKEALRGVGGTRNCDWWFTDQAILLDTAGRYTTQDSDRASDAAGWKGFLGLLRRFRKRRPINGVLVAMSLADLATQSDAERARHVAAVRERLDELHRELKIELPVYLVLTKADLLAGFNEFFDDLPQQGRAQVLGTTFALERSRAGTAAQQLAPELDALLERLNARMLGRLQSERDLQRRGLIFGFPRQLAGIRHALESFVGETFGAGAFEGGFWLRGVYFTSGTQEGTPIDRMLGALARTFGLGVKAVATSADRGKAYFIQRLLSDVVFRESGLAGVNRLAEVRQALVQAGAYVGALAVTLLLLLGMIVSYGRNRSYLSDVAAAAQPIAALPPPTPANAAADLPRLDAYGAVELAASRNGQGVPLSMRFGLSQRDAIYGAAHDAYLRELNVGVVPALAGAFHDQMTRLPGDAEKLYEYLKAYLMLGSPGRLVPAEMQFMGDHVWRSQGGLDDSTVERLDRHLAALLADPARVQPVPLDTQLVEQARTSLRQASLPVLMYSRLKLSYAGDTRDAIHLDQEIGLGGTSAFMRRSGTPLSQPVPALYTRTVFDRVAATGKYEVARDFIGESWVLGPGVASAADLPKLADGMMQLYEDDYIRYWDSLLADIAPRAAASPQQLADMMALLAGATSPLKRLLVIAADNTNLLKPPPKSAQAAASVKAAIATKLSALEQTFGATPAAQRPGTRVTQHFAALQKLVEGPPGAAPIDQTLHAISQIQQQLAGIGGGLGDTNALSAVASQAQASALAQLRVAALQLPPPVSGIVAQIGSKGEAVAKAQAGEELARRYRTEVAAQCRELISGRYPFAPRSQSDVALADFARLLGPNGVFDTFFQKNLSPLVDTTTRPWRWRQGAGGIASQSLLREFETADRIGQIFFPPGSQLPTARFTATPESLDASVRRLEVDIDGQKLEYRHGPQVPQPLVWPGPAPGQASVLFEESGGTGPHRAYQGPWALFRLLDSATVRQETPLKYVVTLQAGGRTASLLLEAGSAINPFGQTLLRGFRCGG
ncbi:MAG TPA: type VI secretion system membrane subunit TssM [Steroidobacteraceae bacterium]|nr:type VI secretion system membrane subunit TssM [Steroidobacteraceae bacterium]